MIREKNVKKVFAVQKGMYIVDGQVFDNMVINL